MPTGALVAAPSLRRWAGSHRVPENIYLEFTLVEFNCLIYPKEAFRGVSRRVLSNMSICLCSNNTCKLTGHVSYFVSAILFLLERVTVHRKRHNYHHPGKTELWKQGSAPLCGRECSHFR